MKLSQESQRSLAPYMAPSCLVVVTEVRTIMCQSYRTGSNLPDAEEENWGTL